MWEILIHTCTIKITYNFAPSDGSLSKVRN